MPNDWVGLENVMAWLIALVHYIDFPSHDLCSYMCWHTFDSHTIITKAKVSLYTEKSQMFGWTNRNRGKCYLSYARKSHHAKTTYLITHSAHENKTNNSTRTTNKAQLFIRRKRMNHFPFIRATIYLCWDFRFDRATMHTSHEHAQTHIAHKQSAITTVVYPMLCMCQWIMKINAFPNMPAHYSSGG